MNTILNAALLLLCLMLSPWVRAADACKAPSPDCVVVGEWHIAAALGAGTRTNPVLGNSDIPLLVIPQISYYGKRFFLESLEFGLTLHENDAFTFNLIATPGYDRVFFVRNDLQNVIAGPLASLVGEGAAGDAQNGTAPSSAQLIPVHHRRTTYLLGPEWTFRSGPIIGQLDALYEATGEHEGYEVRAALAASLLQSHGSLVLSGGLTWKSAALVQYYYGLEGVYTAGSSTNPFLKLGYSLPVSERWTLSAFAHYEHLGGAIARSPIIDSSGVVTAFAGFVFEIL